MQCISGFEVKVVTSDNYITRDSGLMYEDIKVGTGNSPKDGQQVLLPKWLVYFLLFSDYLFVHVCLINIILAFLDMNRIVYWTST